MTGLLALVREASDILKGNRLRGNFVERADAAVAEAEMARPRAWLHTWGPNGENSFATTRPPSSFDAEELSDNEVIVDKLFTHPHPAPERKCRTCRWADERDGKRVYCRNLIQTHAVDWFCADWTERG